MDDFQPSDLVWFVAVDAGAEPRPVVVLTGEGAQALVDTVPDLFRILVEIGMPERCPSPKTLLHLNLLILRRDGRRLMSPC
jgi:hypothetical protein